MLIIIDVENQDSNEKGAEDDNDKTVNGYDGWSNDKVTANNGASVNEARVAVHKLTVAVFLKPIFCPILLQYVLCHLPFHFGYR